MSSVESVSRASYIQRSMWASAQRYRAMPLNVMILAWQWHGPIQHGCLEAALYDLAARHPTLRARLTMQGGQLLQEVLLPAPLTMTVWEAEGSTLEARLDSSLERLRAGARVAIDVVAGPPFRVELHRLAADLYILGLYVHHAMCDGWSSQILIRDLAVIYEARCSGRVAELPQLLEQAADVAEAQIACYESGGYSDEITYWKAELSNLPPALNLPTSGPRKGNRDFHARSPVHAEPLVVLTAIRDAARKCRVSAFSFQLAAVSVLLHQRTAAKDLIVGVPTLNRWSSTAMGFVGCATSLLPARIRVSSPMAFNQLCVQVHATVRRLLAYGRIPLELILRETQDSPLGGQVFPVWCQTRQEAPPVRIDSLGLSMSPLLIERGSILADLDVDMVESAAGLVCEFAHRPSLFAPEWIDSLMTDFGSILRAAAHEPDAAIDSLMQRCGR